MKRSQPSSQSWGIKMQAGKTAVCLFTTALFLSATLYAQVPAPASQPATTTSDGQLIELGGTRGMFFPMIAARSMLQNLKLGQAAIQLQSVYESRVMLSEQNEVLLKQQLKTTEQLAQIWKDAVITQRDALVASEKWYNARGLWFVIGFLVAASTGVAIAGIYKSVNK